MLFPLIYVNVNLYDIKDFQTLLDDVVFCKDTKDKMGSTVDAPHHVVVYLLAKSWKRKFLFAYKYSRKFIS